MGNLETSTIDYNELIKKGLRLSEADFKVILNSLITGAEEAKKFLNASDDLWPKFNFSNDIAALGFSSKADAICLSMSNLNEQAGHLTPLEYKDQLIVFMPDVFYIIIKYLYWLKLLGREATIHRYQKIGNAKLHVQFPDKLPASFSPKLLLLSNVEVEARIISDDIASEQGENPIWKNVDDYLSKNYPQYYNKPIEELAKLSKPDFPISFEMEYYAV